jgi:CBS domain-containing protein
MPMASATITTATPPANDEETCDFLRRFAPFHGMRDETLRALVPRLKLAYFAKDATILSAQGGPVTHLHIVQRGVVGSRPNDAQADPDRTLGPGELFPVGALSAGGATTKIFHAMQDTFCYLLSREDFLDLRRESPEFERYCTQAITETLKQSLAQLQGQYSQLAAEQQTLTRPLADLLRRAPVTTPASAPLTEALARMRDATVRTIVVVNDAGAPVGIFTLIDLLQRVVLTGRPLSTPVAEVMTAPAITVAAEATAYEALAIMAERQIRQLIVVDGDQVAGLVSERDLFSLQRVSMRQVTGGLRAAKSVDELKRIADDIRRLTQNLLAQGVAAEPLTRTIVSLNGALSRRVVEITLLRHDLGDTDWCWLALGSEGRGEQTFATDQDNAILFAGAEADAAAIRERLLACARDVNQALDSLGFPLCTGNVMAGNPDLCLSFEEWQAKFLAWIQAPSPAALLQANIMFDFRAVYGEAKLADRLRTWLFGYTEANPAFLRLMVQNALEVEPPVGLIRAFTVDDAPGAKGTIDLKARGTRVFVDCARVFALALGIAETGTADRLRIAGARLRVEPRHVDSALEAFHFLQLLRLRQQDTPGAPGGPNRIDPYALNEVAQRMLKEAFRQAKQLQERLRLSYRL